VRRTVVDRRDEDERVVLDVLRALAAAFPVSAVVAGLTQAAENRQTRKWQSFVNELVASFSDELELLTQRVSDEAIQELVFHGLRRATEATRDTQVRLLARIAADGTYIGDRRTIDRGHLLLEMAAGLEPIHVEILRWIQPVRNIAGDVVFERGGAYSTHEVEENLPSSRGVVEPVLSSLQAKGLVVRDELDMDPHSGATTLRTAPLWKATEFAWQLLDFLSQIDAEGDAAGS
jgi:hypothetical protein